MVACDLWIADFLWDNKRTFGRYGWPAGYNLPWRVWVWGNSPTRNQIWGYPRCRYHGNGSGESIPDGDLPIAILSRSGELTRLVVPGRAREHGPVSPPRARGGVRISLRFLTPFLIIFLLLLPLCSHVFTDATAALLCPCDGCLRAFGLWQQRWAPVGPVRGGGFGRR
jgi:hypothetical protein